jgi:hypothetical protein
VAFSNLFALASAFAFSVGSSVIRPIGALTGGAFCSVLLSGVCLFAFLPPSLSRSSRPLLVLRSGSAESSPLTIAAGASNPNFFARSASFFASSSSEIPNRLALCARFSASLSASVCWMPIEKSCLGASTAGAGSVVVAVAASAALGASPALTVASVAFAGSA